MAVIVVDSLLSVKGDGLTSMAEAFKAAVDKSLATGLEVTIRFDSAMDIQLAQTLVVPPGAKIVIDGMIEGSNTIEVGHNGVTLHGDSGTFYDPNSTQGYGHTMVEVAAGGSLRLSDVGLSDNLVAGADGKNGASGDNGLNGSSGDEEGLPGTPGNGGLTVGTNGTDGKDAVSGILNMGTLVLDRVNMNGLKAYAGAGGAAGDGGNGGDGGDGNQAPAGPGGPGGGGTGHGGAGGDAVAGVMNLGTMTMMDTFFQTDFVFSGGGGAGGSGGSGGDGGSGTFGGFGGNGGNGGNGGAGGDAAVTVFNRGAMNVAGGWIYNPGSNLIWGGSGAPGAAGTGGEGGAGGNGSELNGNGFDGVGGSNGSLGQAGAGAAAIGWSGATTSTAYYIEANRSVVDEYKGEAGQMVELIIYRIGDASAAGSVTLGATALTGGATGSNLQGGLFAGQVVNFAAGQEIASVYLFAATDHLANGDQDYRFTLTGATGGVLGGHVATDVTVRDADVVGDGGNNSLTGHRLSEVISAGAGNDTMFASAGDDQLDGETGFDTVDYSSVQRGRNGAGLFADVINFVFSGKGVGTDQVFNVDVIIASAFNDKIIGGFNGEKFALGAGNDTASGGFGNDTLLGQGGNDRLAGGDLSDSISGGAGLDVLIGGSGADRFVFEAALWAGNVDHIKDFSHVDDTIVLTRTGAGPFDALGFGVLEAKAFHLGAEATKAAQHILYDRATGTLAYDADGVGGAAAVVFAVLDNMAKLDASDFFIL